MSTARRAGLAILVSLVASGSAAAPGASESEAAPSGALRPGWVVYALELGDRRAYLKLAVEEASEAWIELELGEDPRLVAPLARWRVRADAVRGMLMQGEVLDALSPTDVVPPVSSTSSPSADAPSGDAADRPMAEKVDAGDIRVRSEPSRGIRTAAGRIVASPVVIERGDAVVLRLWSSEMVPVLGLVGWERPLLGGTVRLVAFGGVEPPAVLPVVRAR